MALVPGLRRSLIVVPHATSVEGVSDDYLLIATMQGDADIPAASMIPNTPTDYSKFVIRIIPRMTKPTTSKPLHTASGATPPTASVDQKVLRQCINLSSSFLVTDTTLNPEGGVQSWLTGFSQLIDMVCFLHNRGELELETMNAASKACSECWSVGGCWKGLEEARDVVRETATRLKKLLDANGKTYKGERIYAP